MRQLAALVTLLAVACAAPRVATQEVQPYPLDMCLVMDSKLGSMGDPISRVYEGREVKFCCQPCVAEFEADPEFYMEQLAARVAEDGR